MKAVYLIAGAMLCMSVHASASALKEAEHAALKGIVKHEINKNEHKNRYFVEMDGAVTDNDSVKVDPSLKLGAFLYKDVYGYIESTWQEKSAFKYRNMDYKFGLGWTKEIEKVVPFVELNYTQHGAYEHGTWKDNLGYDFGIKYDIKGKYLPFVSVDDLFDNKKSDVKAGLEYKINERLSALADLTVMHKNVEKSTDVALVYTF